jgi:hypothetical protein
VDARDAGIVVVFAGLAIVVLGVLISTGALSWFGRLPGDVRIEGRSVKVYAPIVSMLLLSLGLSFVLALVRRFF